MAPFSILPSFVIKFFDSGVPKNVNLPIGGRETRFSRMAFPGHS